MRCAFYWVDAFTDRVFAGNPAGICPLDTWPEDALLQRIAWQNGLAETAYLVPCGKQRYHLRWFTPRVEVDLCGHATLAAAHVLFHEQGLTGDAVTFESRSGPLVVRRGAAGRLVLDFPARPAEAVPTAHVPAALVRGLGGAASTWIGRSRDYLCVLPDAAAVRALRPDFGLLAQLDTLGVIVTARGEADCDFVSRFFAPRAGVDEDPVTGSAHCTLVPYWARELGRTELHARQCSLRGGELWCRLAGDRVHLGGHAVTYLRGEITT